MIQMNTGVQVDVGINREFANQNPNNEPIAIIGIGCNFPGGLRDPDGYWRFIEAGKDAIQETPASRWSLQRFYSPVPSVPGKTHSKWGGYIEGIDQFDPLFFGISPREAANIDPQHRMLLETAWRAIEDAGSQIEF
jgi:acyl transferase domain-containing protein